MNKDVFEFGNDDLETFCCPCCGVSRRELNDKSHCKRLTLVLTGLV